MDFNDFASTDSENSLKQEASANFEDTNNKIDSLTNNLDKCNEELIKQKEQYLRVNADFQNFQRRVEKEKVNWINEGRKSALIFLIPMLDELDFAINSAQKQALETKDFASWLEGFKLIQRNFEKRLSEFGVEQINCEGEFNPSLHEALMQVESPQHKSGEIVQVFKKGYMFKGDVLSHAKVSVAK